MLLAIVSLQLRANNIRVQNVQYNTTTGQVSFDLSWENAWRQTTAFHDAAWVFCKYRTVNAGRWLHADIKAGSTAAAGSLETSESNDRLGFFVRLKTDSTGHVAPTRVSFEPENMTGVFPDFQVFAVEMVYVPQGPFYVGPAPGTNYNTFGDIIIFGTFDPVSGNVNPVRVNSEADNIGVNAPVFPRGFNAFYCMKHEISNEQLVSFFNNAGYAWVNRFGFISRNGTYLYRNDYNWDFGDTLAWITGTPGPAGVAFSCDSPHLYHPALMTPLTLVNYLGWAGLVPMTEYQFEKACRGPLMPVIEEVAAGVSRYEATLVSDTAFSGLFTENEKLKNHYAAPFTLSSKLKRCGYAADSSTNRLTSNASFYGILNMSDNILEIVVSQYDLDSNRNFTGASRKTEYYFEPAEINFNAYFLRCLGEHNYLSPVIYKRGDESGPENAYNAFDMTNVGKTNPQTTKGYFRFMAGGRGVRRAN